MRCPRSSTGSRAASGLTSRFWRRNSRTLERFDAKTGSRPDLGGDEAVVEREDDRGGPVAQVELGEDVADVALDGRFADEEQRLGDLGVGRRRDRRAGARRARGR